MPNHIIQYMQTQIGKPLSKSPSPLARWLNGTLQEAQEGSLTIDFKVRTEMTNPMGILHGGMVAAIMDDVIGATVFCLGADYFYTSVNLTIDFISSAREGDTVRAVSRIVRQGRNIVNAECSITGSGGKLLARGTSNLIMTTIKTNSATENTQ